MIKTKYTAGFEKFWKAWKKITNRITDKPEAFKYWKRDKLDGDEDELIRRLFLQAAERKRIKATGVWQPEWCFCRKWLNKRRYEYIPEPPKERKIVEKPLTEAEKKRRAEMYSPEQIKAKAEYHKMVERLDKKMTPATTISPKEFNDRRNKALNTLKG